MSNESASPNAPFLTRWLLSWVQPDGAIHGFHNHSVWGDNPLVYRDYGCGHSTFASPLIVALAIAYSREPNATGLSLIERLLTFQTNSRQADGQFDHIGFQCGDSCRHGLIHNVVPCVATIRAAQILGDHLSPELRAKVEETVLGVLDACSTLYGEGAGEGTTANQELTRIWARLLYMDVFGHDTWDNRIKEDLDYLRREFFVYGLPDAQSAGTLRHLSVKDATEPAEYYGLMIHPLLLAHARYGNTAYLELAAALARHVIRSAWTDAGAHKRLHRLWTRIDGDWVKLNEPMLIGGMGITLSSLLALTRISHDAEVEAFLVNMDRTYAAYQCGAGFFLGASGWNREQDIIPASAWQSHDLMYLVDRQTLLPDFWETALAPMNQLSAALGTNLVWLEDGERWAVRGIGVCGLELVGRKDAEQFFTDAGTWIPGREPVPTNFKIPDQPVFLRTQSETLQVGGKPVDSVLNASGRPFRIAMKPANESGD